MTIDESERLRRQLAERAYHVCEYCLIHQDDTFWGCQVDHSISRKHGGGLTEPANLDIDPGLDQHRQPDGFATLSPWIATHRLHQLAVIPKWAYALDPITHK